MSEQMHSQQRHRRQGTHGLKTKPHQKFLRRYVIRTERKRREFQGTGTKGPREQGTKQAGTAIGSSMRLENHRGEVFISSQGDAASDAVPRSDRFFTWLR